LTPPPLLKDSSTTLSWFTITVWPSCCGSCLTGELQPHNGTTWEPSIVTNPILYSLWPAFEPLFCLQSRCALLLCWRGHLCRNLGALPPLLDVGCLAQPTMASVATSILAQAPDRLHLHLVSYSQLPAYTTSSDAFPAFTKVEP
jgi:hypothetical protein